MQVSEHHVKRVLLLCGTWLAASAAMWSVVVKADETHSRYFEQLRRRGLYSLAEGYAISRLSQPNIAPSQQTELAVELSRTLAEHAGFASDEQQAELWKRARTAVDDRRTQDSANPRNVILAVQSATVTVMEGDWLKNECELRPFDEELSARTRAVCSSAIGQLQEIERQLNGPMRDALKTNRSADGNPSSHEMRVQLHHVRFQLAVSLRNRAERLSADSRERQVDLDEAEQTFRKLIGVSDEPLTFRAKLGLAACSRLKGELERGQQMVTALEEANPRLDDELLDELVAERARLLLTRHRGADAVELIVRARSQRKRLTGELWFLQVRALGSMRDAALQRKDEGLAEKLREQAEITLKRCDDQVGGFWSRRCRASWESFRTVEKYGPALDTAMQQARADFLAGRVDAALKGYTDAERAAVASGQADIAVELGYTHASILLRAKRYESAATEFLRLGSEFPNHSRAAAAHLNGAYCLGQIYEEAKTEERCETYTQALDRHIEVYANNSTADDARFFKAQLEEQRRKVAVALSLYLQVHGEHSRAAEAHSGAARCYEEVLFRMREQKVVTDQFEREAVETLSRFVASPENSDVDWTVPQAEVALHLASLLLQSEPPVFDRAEFWLGAVLANARRVTDEDAQGERWKRLRQRAAALRIVALAGSGQTVEAERQMNSLAAASPRDLLVVVERLTPFVASHDRQRCLRYAALQLRAAERLSEQRKSLPESEQQSVDRHLSRAYLASGQLVKGLEMLRRQAEESPKNSALQREIALLLETVDDPEFLKLSKHCWRRVESSTKQGTAEWLTARLGVIGASNKLNQHDEAHQLLDVTKLLYPELGGPDLHARFVEMERQLGSSRSKANVRN